MIYLASMGVINKESGEWREREREKRVEDMDKKIH